MPKYMIIFKDDENGTSAFFTDSYEDASGRKMDAECGLGIYSEIYVREENEEGFNEYKFLEA